MFYSISEHVTLTKLGHTSTAAIAVTKEGEFVMLHLYNKYIVCNYMFSMHIRL